MAYNKEIRAVMHPKNFEGEVSNSPNVDGVYVNKAMYDLKNGFYSFMWQNPGESHPRPKMAYVKYFEPWDWVIIMGSYEDNFYKDSQYIKNLSIVILAISLIIVLTVAVLISRHIAIPISRIATQVNRLSNGDLTLDPLDVKNKDEIGETHKTWRLQPKNKMLRWKRLRLPLKV